MRKQSWNSSRGCHSRSFLQPYIFQELLEHQVTPWIWWDGATSTPPMQSQQHLECLELVLSIPFWGKREFSGELMPPPSSPLSREWRWHFPAGSTASAERLFPWKQSPSNLQRTQSSGKENSAIKAKAGLFLAKFIGDGTQGKHIYLRYQRRKSLCPPKQQTHGIVPRRRIAQAFGKGNKLEYLDFWGCSELGLKAQLEVTNVRESKKTFRWRAWKIRKENWFISWRLELFSNPKGSGITELDQGIAEFNWKYIGQSHCAVVVFLEQISVAMQLKRCQRNSIQKSPEKISLEEFTLKFKRIHSKI